MKGADYYDQVFKQYGPVHEKAIRHRVVADVLRGSVLDVGCGEGALADWYDGEYYGIDFSEEAIKLAEGKRGRFEVKDAITDEIEGEYDTIVMTEFLEHIDEESEKKVLTKLKKNLKPGGQMVISVPNQGRIFDPSHVREFSKDSLREKFEGAQFVDWEESYKTLIFTYEASCMCEDAE